MIIISACQKDFLDEVQEESQKQNPPPFTSRIVSTQEFQNNILLMENLSKFTSRKENTQLQSRDVYVTDYDFTIHTDVAKYIEYADGVLHSYTFAVFRENENGVENLVLALNGETGVYDAFLVQYVLSENQKEELLETEHISTSYRTNVTSLEGDFSNVLASRLVDPCSYSITTYHITPDGSGTYQYGDGDQCQHEDDYGNSSCEVYSVLFIDCPTNPGGSTSSNTSGTSDNNQPFDPNDVTNGGSNNNGSNTNNNSDPNNGNIVTSPIYFDITEANNIAKLTAIVETPVIKTRIADYRTRIPTDLLERGSEFRTNPDGTYYEYQIPLNSLRFSGTQFPQVLVNTKVRLHMHHDNTNSNGEALAPVPSAEDVFGMASFYTKKEALNATDSEEIVSIVETRRGLYAFKIGNPTRVNDFNNELNSNIVDGRGNVVKFRDLLKKIYKKDVEDKVVRQCQSQGGCTPQVEEALWELFFLEFFKKLDSGLKIYLAFYDSATNTYQWQLLN